MAEQTDQLIRFILPKAYSRGAIVRARGIHAEVGRVHGLSGEPQMLLTHTLLGASLLHAVSKGGVRHVLQVDGETGPVERAMAESGKDRLRGYLQWREGKSHPSPPAGAGNLRWLGSPVQLACVRDLGFGQPYVSRIVGSSPYLADCLVKYLHLSVQVRADIILHDDLGLMLEAMPGCDDEHWIRAMQSMAAISDQQLGQPVEWILEAFSALDCTILDRDELTYACGCNPQAMAETLQTLDIQDTDDLLDEDGNITVSCRYCDKSYAIRK